MPAPHSSFLVTSVGAYHDSGLGTGGLTCLHEGRAAIVDKLDSTGLTFHGGMAYRFVRGLHSLVGYEEHGVRSVLRLPEIKDVHDVAVHCDQFVCVSTGSNEVVWVNAFGNITRRWKAPGDGDAWHLNCLGENAGQLYLSAFGRFSTHRGWLGQCTGTGFIVDLETGEEVVSGLNGPHNPRLIEGQWVVCDSHDSSLVIISADGTKRRVDLGGFTRGLAFDTHHFFVGVSANRKAASPDTPSLIAIVDRATLEVVGRLEVPFPEIYEIALIPAEFAQRMVENVADFEIDPATERLRHLERQVELGLEEIASLNQQLADSRRQHGLRGTLGNVKRALTGSR